KTTGDQKALEIYHELLNHTLQITQNLSCKKCLYYSDFIDYQDIWPNEIYQKSTQKLSNDLGIRMASAFKEIYDSGFENAAIIGSDCLALDAKTLEDTFTKLTNNQAVIGKVEDGGYYLLGLNFDKLEQKVEDVLEAVFLNKEWSHANVANEALAAFEKLNLKYDLMPTLTDIDEYEDYINHKKKHQVSEMDEK
ncbi:MAG: TIGR04282 family arsenosugar biosynthesis glycosyltransferase, partial [Spirosomaceae bacterium]|nr:TIGR04282 family arsenosugar biosynthesis glycosyltransferase [Spirosomataceae bacterium]